MRTQNKKVVWHILNLYIFSSAIFLFTGASFVYTQQKQAIFTHEALKLRSAKFEIISAIKTGQIKDLANIALDLGFQVTTKADELARFESGVQAKDNRLYYKLSGAKNKKELLIIGQDLSPKILDLKLKLILFCFLVLVCFGVVAFFLVRIFLKPLNTQIKMLARFIKDSTHELKAPLSVIQMSLETIDKEGMSEKTIKKLKNIESSCKNLNAIYDDLILLSFGAHKINKTEFLLDELIKERLGVFELHLQHLDLRLNLRPTMIKANKDNMTKLIDNLLSNISKYASKSAKISLCQNKIYLSNDTTSPVPRPCEKMFEIYARFNDSKGGFGLGLAIIKTICKEESIKLSCKTYRGVVCFCFGK